ncbi:DUF3761 domain-containing protein [Caulobacter sp. KR2-114]|uniref:DUF3761 domain-containing protein n=1 Tax=Caulobacter sp. KR2-114 TaxID=3400912 RepID=UPI003BFC30E4
MRLLTLALSVAMAAGGAADARGHRGDTYINSDGVVVHRPVRAPSPPPGATAQCRDGTYSFSLHHQGTCSYHGGVMS